MCFNCMSLGRRGDGHEPGDAPARGDGHEPADDARDGAWNGHESPDDAGLSAAPRLPQL